MPLIIGCVSQKGGVGKSTLARTLAVIVKRGGMNVLLADLDVRQSTSLEWAKLRDAHGITPHIPTRSLQTVDDALIAGGMAAVLVVDAPACAGAGIIQLAREADLLVQPSGCSLDDLRPAILLFHELLAAGIARERLVVALCRSAGEVEEDAARRYLQKARYQAAATSIPECLKYRDSMNRGGALVETSDKNRNLRAQTAIDELLKMLRSRATARARQRKEQAR